MSAKKERKTVATPPSLSSGRFSSNWLALQAKLSESKLEEEKHGKKELSGRRKRAADKPGETAAGRKRSKPSDQDA